MSLFNRLNTLLRADAHGVVDALEDQALLLKQTLREAEIALNQKRARAETLVAEGKALTDGGTQLVSQIEALDDDIRLALEEGKDDLAKFAIRKLLPLRREREAMATRLAAVERSHAELAEQLVHQEHDFEALKVRVRNHLARLEVANEDDSLATFTAGAVEEEEVELELLRRQQGAGDPPRGAHAEKGEA